MQWAWASVVWLPNLRRAVNLPVLVIYQKYPHKLHLSPVSVLLLCNALTSVGYAPPTVNSSKDYLYRHQGKVVKRFMQMSSYLELTICFGFRGSAVNLGCHVSSTRAQLRLYPHELQFNCTGQPSRAISNLAKNVMTHRNLGLWHYNLTSSSLRGPSRWFSKSSPIIVLTLNMDIIQ